MLQEAEFKRRKAYGREPVRILLLEDDPAFVELVRMQLRTMPWVELRLEVAVTLAEALSKLAAERFGLVLTDLFLPDASGLQAVEAICRNGEQLVIALTADRDPALRAGALECGAYDFMCKADMTGAAFERLLRLASIQAQSYQSLRESEARFRSLLALSSDSYWETDVEHRLVQIQHDRPERPVANRAQVGKARWETPSTYPDAQGWAAHRATLEAHLPFRDFEIARLDADGGERHRLISGEPVFDVSGVFKGYRGVGKDITRLRRAEEELRRFRLAMDTSADMILLIDRASMRLIDVNSTACRLLGYSREELLGMGPQDVLPVSREELERAYDQMIADPSTVGGMKSYYRCKDGSRLPFESTRRVLRSGARWVIAAISRDIRERIAADKAVRESEERFRSLTALSSDWYWEQDEQFRLTFMSTIENTGLDAAAYLGRQRWDQPALNLTEEDWARHRAQLERHESFHDFEMERPGPDAGTVWVSLSGEPVFDAAGAFKGYRGIGRDITQRKRSEREAMQLARMYAALGAANEAILRAKSPQEVFERACEIAVEAGGFQLCTVFMVDPDVRILARVAASGMAAPLLKDVVPVIDDTQSGPGGLLGYACRTGQPAIANDYQSDPRTEGRREHVGSYRPASGAAFPLFAEGRLAAVLGLHHAERNAFSNELISLLQRLAGDIAYALENFRRDSRRVRAEEDLRRSETRFRSLTELSSDWYWEMDEEMRYTAVKGKGLIESESALIGTRREDLAGIDSDEAAWRPFLEAVAARQPFSDVVYSRIVGGERRFISISGAPVFDAAAGFIGYRGVGKDVTERKREEALLRVEHAVTRCLTDAKTESSVVTQVIRVLCESEGWECGRYFALDEKEDVLRFSDAWGTSSAAVEKFIDKSRGITYRRGQGLTGTVWDSGEPLWVSDVSKDPRTSGSSRADSARASLQGGSFVFPVISDGRTLGVMSFSSATVREPDARMQQAVRVIGSQVGLFLQRRRAEERQATHLRHQERVARFGQTALGKREPQDLIDEAVQTVLEALTAEAVAYVEPGPAQQEFVLRACVGAAVHSGAIACAPDDPLARVLRTGGRLLTAGAALPFAWARNFDSAVLIPVRGEQGARGVLCVFCKAHAAFAAEELNFVEAVASVLSTALQRVDSESRLAFLAQFDPLTGLPNRALLADRFSQMIVQARRHAAALGVLFIDLDEFKMVNDTLGHAGGDELLKEVAVRLQGTVRAGDTVARISGDEFAVVLGDLAQPEDAALVAQKIIERLSQAVAIHGQEAFVTASVGIAIFPGDGGDAEALLGAADAAMYRAKQSGRNAYQFFTAEINQRSRARALMGVELRRALERQEFALVYQPKFDLADRSVCGAEALLRWKHPERGTISASEFVPVLEETGLIVPVGEWVLRRACEDLKAWQAAGLCPGPMAVNLSARQFRLPDLDKRIKAIVAAAGIDHGLIELEITESQLMQDPDQAILVMRALRDAGMRIAIDDFGTGYSSLSYLTRFPVSSLKIDSSFVRDVNVDASDAAIVRTIIEMAHTLGFSVVAEGIETEAQAAYLRAHGCEQAQGFLFARPMPAEELAKLFLQSFARAESGNSSARR